jgi:hypothetical protein
MIQFIRGLSAAVILMLAASPAGAAFHLWTMTEMYSNGDGTVQYIEFRALSGGQQFVSGHSLSAGTKEFELLSNLPGDTSGRNFLIGTQGFAALGVVQPDYVMPNGFIPLGGGTINWGEGSDLWNYGALPTDGTSSLQRNGSVSPTNRPTNFAGQSGTVVLPAAGGLNYQGLWWKSPAGSESGWGLNVTHQGDKLFATWFTYDTDGSGMWLVMSDLSKGAAASYSGQIYRTVGAPFNSVPFDSTRVVNTPVGSATLTFTDVDNGSFAYTVNGVSQTKAITKLIYSTPTPTCTAGGAPPATPNYQDLWWASPAGSENGWGVNLAHQGNILFATWFTYGADGKGLWLVGSNLSRTVAGTYTGPLYRTTGPAFSATPWLSGGVAQTEVGSATFTFSDASNGTFAYTVNGISQTKPITRLVFSTPATVCR